MPEKELGQTAEWLTQILPFVLAIALSCLGGIVSYLNRIDKHGKAFSFIRLSIEVLTSGFVGIISFMLCDYAKLEWSTTAAIVAISGHMGTRALFLVENIAINISESILKRNGYDVSNSKRQVEQPKETD